MTPLDRARARKIIADGYPIGPRLHPCICTAPLHAHTGTKHTGGHEPTGCRRYRRDGADALAEKAMYADQSDIMADIGAWLTHAYPRPTPTDGGLSIGPSDVGRCPHQIQLRERPPADLYTNDTDDTAALLGTMWHHMIRSARQWRYPHRKYEFELTIPGLDRTGRMDEYDPLTCVGTDYKTVSENQWEERGQNGARDSHFGQLAIYCYALTCAGYPVRVMRLIYIRRATGECFYVNRPYDEDFAKQALAELTATAIAIELGQELPRHGRGPTSDPICRNWCPFRDYCWNVPQAEAAGRTPESWTILGPHPELEAIEWAAENALEWKTNRNEATREYKAAIPLLGGITDGTYGEYIIKEKTRLMPDYKTYFETVATEYERWTLTPADQRGDFATVLARIPLPHRRDTWTDVRRVHAAHRTTDRTTEENTPR